MTTQEFIHKAKQIHGDKYDYSKAEYVNSRTKICIICSTHGEFWQTPSEHLKGSGCFRCAHEYVVQLRKKTKEWFLQKANEVHNNKYDYSTIRYVNVTTKVAIICPIHGEFLQTPRNHVKGAGCPQCSRLHAASLRRKSNEDFLIKAREVHGEKYDYSKVEYKDAKTSVTIICPIHGEFEQTPTSHLSGSGCSICNRTISAAKRRKSTEDFIKKAQAVHGDKYDYSKVEYVTSATKVCIICKDHGEFWQLPNSHIKGHGCLICRSVGNTKYTKEMCLEVAKKCNSRVEFSKKYPLYVAAAQYHGWYKECCAHMGRKGNKQRVIYVYEFEASHAAYIGLTFSMDVRNKRHHKEGTVYEYAKKCNIAIPIPKILTEHLPQDEAAIQEGVWTQYYRENGWKILNRIKTGSLGGQEKLDYDLQKIENSMIGYNSLTEWANDFSSYRDFIQKQGLDYLLDKHFPSRMVRKYDDFEECQKAYRECSSLVELKAKYPGALAAAKRHNWHNDLSKLCRVSRVKWTKERCIEVIANYTTLKDFKEANNGAYQMIRKNGWDELLKPLKRQLHSHYHFTLEQIKEFCNNAGDYETLKANHPEVLSYCWHKKIDIYALSGWRKSHLRPIRLIKDGVIVAVFDSAKEAAQYAGVHHRNLGRYIDKGIEYHGYIWETDN